MVVPHTRCIDTQRQIGRNSRDGPTLPVLVMWFIFQNLQSTVAANRTCSSSRSWILLVISVCVLAVQAVGQVYHTDPSKGPVPNWGKQQGAVLDTVVTQELQQLGFSQHTTLKGHWATLMGNNYYAYQELYPSMYKEFDNNTYTCAAKVQWNLSCLVNRTDLNVTTFDEVLAAGSAWKIPREPVTVHILKQNYGASWSVPNVNGCHVYACAHDHGT